MSFKLYVGNLPFSATEDDLFNLFSSCGTVEKINLPTDRDSGKPRGFGFVEMESQDGMDNAINTLDGASLGGREIKVTEAVERKSDSSYKPSKPYATSKGNGICIFCGEEDTIYGFPSTTGGVCASCISSLSKASRPRNSSGYSGGYKKRY